MDVRLMTHCWLDRARLVQLLQGKLHCIAILLALTGDIIELSSLLVGMRREETFHHQGGGAGISCLGAGVVLETGVVGGNARGAIAG